MATYTGNAGNNTQNGTGAADLFTYTHGGNDTLRGKGGDDTFNLGRAFSALDTINGGAGTRDKLMLSGAYVTGSEVTFGARTLTNVEQIVLGAGFNYFFVSHDKTVAAKQLLIVNGGALTSNSFKFFGNDESDGRFRFIGGGFNDTVVGGAKNDTFDFTKGGRDSGSGGGGNDTFMLKGRLTHLDAVNGGDGFDTAFLTGNYSAGITFEFFTIEEVERVILGTGFSYRFTTDDGTVDPGKALTIDASKLAAAHRLTFNGSAEDDGRFVLHGGAGTDNLTVGAGDDTVNGNGGADTIHFEQGGSDTINGGAANDTLFAGAGLDATDRIDGGGGAGDVLMLFGNTTVVFAANTVRNVEIVSLATGSDYSITVADATNPGTMTIGGVELGAGDTLTFDGSAETGGLVRFTVNGGAGADTIAGGAGNDTLNGNGGGDTFTTGSGVDTVNGGAGDDIINVGAFFQDTDTLNGGANNDTVNLSGSYLTDNQLTATTLTSIERMHFGPGFSYFFAGHDATVAAGATMVLDASDLGLTDSLEFLAGAETDGHYTFISGNGIDVFHSGDLADIVDYTEVTAFGGASRDHLWDIDFSGGDQIKFRPSTTLTPLTGSGTLPNHPGTDAQLADVIDIDTGGANQLAANGAVLITGYDFGTALLVIDGNNTAGYQANADLVIALINWTGTLDLADLIGA